ncbi:CDP-alcohol phosphatidyltransferase family protein [Thermoleophilia bacterium SCSIO 60948]|nr:CDP-alcohol phosphatidyltransferase family protein [Thermoleophilia bacterium SCSIO 60948]
MSATGEGRERKPRSEMGAVAREKLIESRLTPNMISIAGLIGNLLAAALILMREFELAGLAFIIGSVMDTLDGRYSRMSGKGTLFGAFLDSTLDRIEEGVVLAAIAWHFAEGGDAVPASLCLVAAVGSLIVSYTRARAEALGIECKVGLATRPVRVVILSVGLVLAEGALINGVDLLPASIYVLVALTVFTAAQRIWHVRNKLKVQEGASVTPV